LALISEFNVQMLYLSDLQNLISDFLSHPSLSLEPTGEVATTSATAPTTSRQWLLTKTAAQKGSVFS
jgi:hypothetical protein